jgi:hypothetical protein
MNQKLVQYLQKESRTQEDKIKKPATRAILTLDIFFQSATLIKKQGCINERSIHPPA